MSLTDVLGSYDANIWGPAVIITIIVAANIAAWSLNPCSTAFTSVLQRWGLRPLFFATNR
jgi:hypothetical protein